MSAIAAFFLVTLPWLNPFSPGPTSAVGPYLLSWLCAGLLLLALGLHRQQGRADDMLQAIALGWLTAATLSAVIGLLQYFEATAPFGVWINATEIGTAYGNLRQRNQFATLINIGLLALLWLGAQGESGRSRGLMVLCLLLAALLGAANAASSSRTGLLQLGVVLALTWGWQRLPQRSVAAHSGGHWRLILLTAVLAYLAASVVLPLLAGLDPASSGAWARLRTGDAVCSSRLTLWRNVLHLIAQKPWLGWGWGELDYAHFITLYPGARFCDILDNAHNLPLHIAVELGVPAAVLACLTALWLVWLGQPWRETQPVRQMAWGVLAVILLHSLLEYPLWYGPFQMAAALSVWLLVWYPRSGLIYRNFKTFSLVAPVTYALIATFIIAIVGFASWNYHLASQIYLAPEERAAAYQTDTLTKTRKVWLFADTVRFADLTTTELNPDNAAAIHTLALEMLHFSPEARVAELVLNSARLLGRTQDVAFYGERYRAAFAADYARWVQAKP